jgi:hypothetical protein
MSSEGVPYSCPRCREDGSPTGCLVFLGQDVPTCKYHPGTVFERSRFYDPDGNRIREMNTVD